MPYYVYNKITGEIMSACNYVPSKQDMDTRGETAIFDDRIMDLQTSKIVGGILTEDEAQIQAKEKRKKIQEVNQKIETASRDKVRQAIKNAGLEDENLANLYTEKEALEIKE